MAKSYTFDDFLNEDGEAQDHITVSSEHGSVDVPLVWNGKRVSEDQAFKNFVNQVPNDSTKKAFSVDDLSKEDMSMLSFDDYEGLSNGTIDPEKLFAAKLKFVGEHEDEINQSLAAEYAKKAPKRQVGAFEGLGRSFMGRAQQAGKAVVEAPENLVSSLLEKGFNAGQDEYDDEGKNEDYVRVKGEHFFPSESERLAERAKGYALQPGETATIPGKVGMGIGQMAVDLPIMMATRKAFGAPAVATEVTGSLGARVAARAGKAIEESLKISAGPAYLNAKEAANRVMESGGSEEEASNAGWKAALQTVGFNALPMSAVGPKGFVGGAKRALTGGALQAGVTAATGGDAGDVLAAGFTGAALGAALGPRKAPSVKAPESVVDVPKEADKQARAARAVGEDSFADGLEFGASGHKPKQLDRFPERTPTMKDMFSGEEGPAFKAPPSVDVEATPRLLAERELAQAQAQERQRNFDALEQSRTIPEGALQDQPRSKVQGRLAPKEPPAPPVQQELTLPEQKPQPGRGELFGEGQAPSPANSVQTTRTHEYVAAQEKANKESWRSLADEITGVTPSQRAKKLGDNLAKELGITSKTPAAKNDEALRSLVAREGEEDLFDVGHEPEPAAGEASPHATGHTPESLKAALEKDKSPTSKIILDLINRGRVVLIGADGVVENLKARMEKASSNLGRKIFTRGYYLPGEDIVHMVADYNTPESLNSLIFHEAGIHAGAQSKASLRDKIGLLSQRVQSLADQGDPTARSVVDHNYNMIRLKGNKSSSFDNENVAKFAEEAEKASMSTYKNLTSLGKVKSLLKDIYSTAKVWTLENYPSLVKIDKITPEDFRALARSGLKEFGSRPGGKPRPGLEAEAAFAGDVRNEDYALKHTAETRNLGKGLKEDWAKVNRGKFTYQGSTVQAALDRTFSSAGKASPAVQVAAENMQGQRATLHTKFQASINRLDAAQREYGLSEQDVGRMLADPSNPELAKYPKIQAEAKFAREHIDKMSPAIVKEFLKHRDINSLSDEQKGVLGATLKNVGSYLHQSYLARLGSKISDKYALSAIHAYEKDPTTGKGKDVADALDYIKEHDLAFPEGLTDPAAPLRMSRLKSVYEAWTGLSAEGLNKNTLIEKLLEIKSRYPDMNAKAYDLVRELLGFQNKESSIFSKRYGEGSYDKSLLTARKPIPPQIRALLGEVKDEKFVVYNTLLSQANLLTKLKFQNTMYEIGTKQGWLKPASEGNGSPLTEVLKGESLGPLNGMRTTPRMRQYLETSLEQHGYINEGLYKFLENSLNAVAAVSRFSKMVRIVGNLPGSFIRNFIGAPSMGLLNGNLSFKYMTKGIEAARGLVGVGRKKELSNLSTMEILRRDLADSGQVGEMRQVEYDRVMNTLLDDAGYSKEFIGALKVKRAYQTARDLAAEAYASTDLWPKFATYWHQKEIFTKINEAEAKAGGETMSPKEIEDLAMNRAKMSNITYNRAFPIIRGVEKFGITQFGTYFMEMYRATATSVGIAVRDLHEAQTLKSPEAKEILTKHAIARLAGTGAALTIQAGLMTVLGSLGMGIAEAVHKGMSPKDKEKNLVKLGDLNENSSYHLDVSQFDNFDPIVGPIRGITSNLDDPSKIPQDVWNRVSEMFVRNAVVSRVFTELAKHQVGDQPGKPSLAFTAPDVYKDIQLMAKNLNMNQGNADLLLRLSEPLTPRILTNIAQSFQNAKTYDEKVLVGLTAAGLNPVVYNPAKELERAASVVSRKDEATAKAELKYHLEPGVKDSVLRDRFEDYAKAQKQASLDLKQKVDAAEAQGLPKAKIFAALSNGGISKLEIADVMSTDRKVRFTPYPVKSIVNEMKEKLSKAKPEERAAINAEYKTLINKVQQLNKQYSSNKE